MDPLSQIIGLFKPQAVFWRVVEAHHAWTIGFRPTNIVVFGQIIEGACHVEREDGISFDLEAGDFLLMAAPPNWTMTAFGGDAVVDFGAVIENPRYEYHRWVSDPGQAVTTAMIDSLRAASVFSTVQTYDGQAHVPYVLQGRLEHLDEVDYENGVRVEVRLFAQLLDTKTGSAVWAGDTTKSIIVEQRQVRSVVQAMGQATQDGVDQLVQDLRNQLFVPTLGADKSTISSADKRDMRVK